MDYDVITGKEDVFVNRFKEVMDLMKSMDLHHETRLFKDVYNDEPSFLVVSEWKTKEGFMEFIKSDVFRETTNWGKEEVLRDRPRHKVYKTSAMENNRPSS
jgi:heme-degrading monooxygenase HmoA